MAARLPYGKLCYKAWLFFVAALAIANGPLTPGFCQMARSGLTNAVEGVEIYRAPVTVKLSSKAVLGGAIAEARRGGRPIALVVEGVGGAIDEPVRINVFINKPDADRATSLEDVHFIGYLQLMPAPGRPTFANFALQVPPESLFDQGDVDVTLVPSVGVGEPPRGATITVQKIELRSES